ncbi:MAG TPA: Asp-tRNA(Asn)/Glu-tRNA(Gln) amidotransferase subunit GatA [Steroidobacteraceae bacterium]|nr:Asp-tRNA(Asn)/Glu-tRNA(Gln) amidotransferase subunit GatA [Steroidobacteraceae bacterium]
MHTFTLAELAKKLRAKEFSATELTGALLDRIDASQPTLNAFITVTRDSALAQARQADAALAAGKAGPLTGLPLAHKDIFCTQGVKTSCGSKMLDNFVSPYDATVVEKLNAAGMVTLGKTNMDEFAMGSSNETSWYGPVRNPWDTQLVPGGSSGGSAAAVAARIAPIATATDTGGSIRQPASLCGVTGIKPTYGRVSRFGMIAFASSLDQGGLISQSAEDAAMVLEAMSGFDPRDSTSVDAPVPNYVATLDAPLTGLKIGLISEFFGKGLDANVEKLIRDALAVYEKLGAKLVDVKLPALPLSVPTYYVVAPAECSSNLARFDGVRYGYRAQDPKDLMDLYKRSRGEGFGAEVKRRIMVGTYVLSAGYYDAYYLKAQRVRQLINQDFKRAFEQVDVLIGPTAPDVAFGIGAKTDDPIQMYLNDIYTIGANLAGVPGISIPCGFVRDLPVGMQICGPHFAEAKLLNVAHKYQQETDWHRRIPAAYSKEKLS